MSRSQEPNDGGVTEVIAAPIRRIPFGKQIVFHDIEKLKLDPRNPRTHSNKQISQIAASFREFGVNSPVLVTRDLQLIAGHGRVAAAKLLGLKQFPTIEISHLSEAQLRAFVIADNKLALEAGWDEDLLALEFEYLDSLDLDFDLQITGFDTVEIDDLFERKGAAKCAPEDFIPNPAQGESVSRLGDVWLLGDHVLFHGDALDSQSYDALLRGSKAEMSFSDPPYNVRVSSISGNGRTKHPEFVEGSGEKSSEEFEAFLHESFSRVAENVADGALVFTFMNWRGALPLLLAAEGVFTEQKNLIVWNKDNGGQGGFYRSKHELIFVHKVGTAPHINNFHLGEKGRYRCNVWDYPGLNTFRKGRMQELGMHPTVKPVALVADAIKDCSNRGSIILDNFCGSGTTIIAAQKTGRLARCVELDGRYVDVAVRRWQAYAGSTARLQSTGEAFQQVSLRRNARILPGAQGEER